MSKIIIFLNIILLLSVGVVDAALFKSRVTEYREEGLRAQKQGDFDKAKEFYQKIVQLDPYNTVAYNDLGVAYEAKGELELAEQSYLKAIQLDPNFLSSYYNLGCLYETLGDYENAIKYITKRIEMGDSSDSWTQRAEEKLSSIKSMLNPVIEEQPEEIPEEVVSEETIPPEPEVVKKEEAASEEKATPEVIIKEIIPPEPPTPLFEQRETQDLHLERAKKAFQEKDYLTAELEALKVLQLNPRNKEAEELLRKSHKRFLVD